MGWYNTKWDPTAASRRWVDTNVLGRNKPGPSTYAGDTYAALTREQWQNYVSTFVPLENQLIDYATDAGKPLEAMAEASADVESSFAMQEGALDRRLRGQGVSLNADEQSARTRSFGLSKALADVGAQNIAGQLTRERQMSVLGNPAPQSNATAAGG